MVCIRCKMVVESELNKLGLLYGKVDLGEVEVLEDMSAQQQNQFKTALLKSGLELIDDHRAILVSRIKAVVVEMVHYTETPPKTNFSHYLSSKLNYNYTYLSNLFAEVTGITIEHYINTHKIERVKELLLYNELSLSEISYKLNYSSVAHLSSQFKKITGLTPSYFKRIGLLRRDILNNM